MSIKWDIEIIFIAFIKYISIFLYCDKNIPVF